MLPILNKSEGQLKDAICLSVQHHSRPHPGELYYSAACWQESSDHDLTLPDVRSEPCHTVKQKLHPLPLVGSEPAGQHDVYYHWLLC